MILENKNFEGWLFIVMHKHNTTYIQLLINISTVEPPNKGHFGSRAFVLFSEVVTFGGRFEPICPGPSGPNIPR